MRFSQLNPELIGIVQFGKIYFDCPFPGCKHSICILISDKPFHIERVVGIDGKKRIVRRWQASGEFPESLTITPSIDIIEADENSEKVRTICWHGHITNGDVT